jgi:hypothetical protein
MRSSGTILYVKPTEHAKPLHLIRRKKCDFIFQVCALRLGDGIYLKNFSILNFIPLQSPVLRLQVFKGLLNLTMKIHSNSLIPQNSARLRKVKLIPLLAALIFMQAGVSLAQGDDTVADDSTNQSSGWEVEQWYIFTSLYTKHWDDDPEHVNNQKLLGGEAMMANNWVFGLAWFDNSFGQNSQYLYAGYSGYKEPYEDKIPLNGLGVAPAILPIMGFQYKWFATELSIAGTAAVTITAGVAF